MSTEKKFALIVANAHYDDAMLRKLIAPPQDALALSTVLSDPAISGFQVLTLIDEPSYKICESIETFLDDRDREDLTLLYFSCHGITDDDGLLYFAATNTQHKRLRSTAIAAGWVNELMTRCRSRRQVLLLDCCHSGAFARTKSAGSVNIKQQVAADLEQEGRGRFVLTASDAFQYSFEGDSVQGEGVRSVFTEALVHGLKTGAADLDGDGLITMDELYRHVHRRVREQTPNQSPRKWESDAEGSLVIAFNAQPLEAALPDDLISALDNLIPEARERAVVRLEKLLKGKHRGLSLAAYNALDRLAEDDSRRVSLAAQNCLATYRDSIRTETIAPLPNPVPIADHPKTPATPEPVRLEHERPRPKEQPPVAPVFVPTPTVEPVVLLPPREEIPLPEARPLFAGTSAEIPGSAWLRLQATMLSFSPAKQIVLCAIFTGVVWAILNLLGSWVVGLLGYFWGRTVYALGGAIIGCVLGLLFTLVRPGFSVKRVRAMALVWFSCRMLSIVLNIQLPHAPVATDLRYLGLYIPGVSIVCNTLAGSLTGLLLVSSVGKTKTFGIIAGGISLFITAVLAAVFQFSYFVHLSSGGSVRNGSTSFGYLVLLGLLEGSVSLGTLLLFFRQPNTQAA
jgi:hypothetical protein